MGADTADLKVILLGTGTSTGIPVIGCPCPTCISDDPRDNRTRSACYVRAGDMGLVIDTGPDFRRQMLREKIDRIDAVLYTHHHFDHVVGMDDLRPYFFANRSPMPCYASSRTVAVLRRMFPYIFERDGTYAAAPLLDLHEVDGQFTVPSRYGGSQTVDVIPLRVMHGPMAVFGYRIGRFAYVTDTSCIPEATFSLLAGVDLLVLNALRHEPHPTHFTIAEAVAVARRVAARQTVFIHITHSILHAEDDANLPERCKLGYDGLTLDLSPTLQTGTP